MSKVRLLVKWTVLTQPHRQLRYRYLLGLITVWFQTSVQSSVSLLEGILLTPNIYSVSPTNPSNISHALGRPEFQKHMPVVDLLRLTANTCSRFPLSQSKTWVLVRGIHCTRWYRIYDLDTVTFYRQESIASEHGFLMGKFLSGQSLQKMSQPLAHYPSSSSMLSRYEVVRSFYASSFMALSPWPREQRIREGHIHSSESHDYNESFTSSDPRETKNSLTQQINLQPG